VKFSLLNAVRNHPAHAYPLAEVHDDYISDAVLGEELGFIRSWYGEHHFRECQWTGSPLLVATSVAARTATLRVGTAVALLPFHDPRRMAEDVAITDVLSHGRLDFGFGPGSQFEEFRSFGIPVSEMNGRMWESIDWIRQAFASTEEFDHHGTYYDIPNMTFTTKPVQEPLPMWCSAMGPKNQQRAAERGFNLIAPVNFGYDDALRAAGRDPAAHEVASMQNLRGEPADPSARITAQMIRDGNAGIWHAAVGTPEDVITALTPIVTGRMGRITELACAFRHPGMRTPETHKSMRLFAEQVRPALQEIEVEAAANPVPSGPPGGFGAPRRGGEPGRGRSASGPESAYAT
jgi:alkanesulfonate monooxygenase SsuD/methylene tetrahydromethanopterin reductase-like flavin-dependent oxidoreductase (luciferase family)